MAKRRCRSTFAPCSYLTGLLSKTTQHLLPCSFRIHETKIEQRKSTSARYSVVILHDSTHRAQEHAVFYRSEHCPSQLLPTQIRASCRKDWRSANAPASTFRVRTLMVKLVRRTLMASLRANKSPNKLAQNLMAWGTRAELARRTKDGASWGADSIQE